MNQDYKTIDNLKSINYYVFSREGHFSNVRYSSVNQVAKAIYSRLSTETYKEYANQNGGLNLNDARKEISKITKIMNSGNSKYSDLLLNESIFEAINSYIYGGSAESVKAISKIVSDKTNEKIAINQAELNKIGSNLSDKEVLDIAEKYAKDIQKDITRANKNIANINNRKGASGEGPLSVLVQSAIDGAILGSHTGTKTEKVAIRDASGNEIGKFGARVNKKDEVLTLILENKSVNLPTSIKFIGTAGNKNNSKYTVHSGGFTMSTINSQPVLDTIALVLKIHSNMLFSRGKGIEGFGRLVGAILADAVVAGTSGRALFSRLFYFDSKETGLEKNFFNEFEATSFEFIGDLYKKYSTNLTMSPYLESYSVIADKKTIGRSEMAQNTSILNSAKRVHLTGTQFTAQYKLTSKK